MNDIELVVGGMTCRRCVREVTSRLRDVPGGERVTANPARSPGPPVRVDDPRRRAGRIRRDHLPARRPARSLTTPRARLDAHLDRDETASGKPGSRRCRRQPTQVVVPGPREISHRSPRRTRRPTPPPTDPSGEEVGHERPQGSSWLRSMGPADAGMDDCRRTSFARGSVGSDPPEQCGGSAAHGRAAASRAQPLHSGVPIGGARDGLDPCGAEGG
jgi:copper chaperone CopZ